MSVAVVILGDGSKLVMGLQILPATFCCFKVVGGGILIKLVPVVGLVGRYDLFCSISRFLVFIIVIVHVRILYRLQLVFDINIKPRFVIGVAC